MHSSATRDSAVESAIETFARGYCNPSEGRRLVPLPAFDGAPEGQVIAVRCDNFRSEPGNWPKIIHHGTPTDRAIVLTHGFKDSPAFQHDIATRFAARGFSVVLPLLPAHGRQDPVAAMRRADYRAWRATVRQAVDVAGMLGNEVSIGGLSTGGLLALDVYLRNNLRNNLRQLEETPTSNITGKVFLFSAALGLTTIQRWVLSTPILPRWRDRWKARSANRGIGGSPHKYSRSFLTGARQVHRILETLGDRGLPPHQLLTQIAADERHHNRIFIAHSEADTTIRFDAVKPLVRPDDPGQHHILAAAKAVRHAELVLAHDQSYQPLWPDEPPPARANPEFEPMMAKALAFLDR